MARGDLTEDRQYVLESYKLLLSINHNIICRTYRQPLA